MFFCFDGADGVGKSTQVEAFCDWLRRRGHDVVACRDPGSTRVGEAVRRILLEEHSVPMCRRSEMLLYMAARAQLVQEVIRPALQAERTVVADRYLLANVVYQGFAGGLDVDELWEIGRAATDGLFPDLTFVLDMEVSQATARIARDLDRMEQQGDEFHRRVRAGFIDRDLLRRAPQPYPVAVINAARSIDEVAAEIRATAERFLGGQLPTG
jgi:dTMP kinase